MSRTPAMPADRDAPPEGRREWALGAHVVTPRGGYVHHGIYVGDDRVVHYGGLARGLRAGPIEVVSMEQFAQGRRLRVLSENSPCFSSVEIVQRALSRVGEDRYHVLTNNCEHFCEWCVRGEQRSHQVDRWFSWPTRATQRATQALASLVSLARAVCLAWTPRSAS
jgi:hypothetical protein